MIAFASLFLGLFLGVKPVEVVVGRGVAAVELRLDGRSLGTMDGSPWIRHCDFGSELAPRHLEAVAFGTAGEELGRVSQWLNLPHEPAVMSVVLEPDEPGRPRGARVSWESSAGAEPKSVTASLDGAPLAVSDPRRIALPAVDDAQLHLLHVELEFEDHVTSRVDLTFGGAYADEVSTEITALAIRAIGKPRRPPSTAGAQAWFVKDGLRVPLFVWDPESGAAGRLEAWGEVRKVGSLKQLGAAFEELSELLDQQWIVWLDGRHLPQEIELSPRAEGFELLR